jgi:hypothetical protein
MLFYAIMVVSLLLAVLICWGEEIEAKLDP